MVTGAIIDNANPDSDRNNLCIHVITVEDIGCNFVGLVIFNVTPCAKCTFIWNKTKHVAAMFENGNLYYNKY